MTDVILKDKWPNRPRTHPYQPPPYGYKTTEEDPKIFVPDVTILPYLEQAFDMLDSGRSYMKTAAWLAEASGKSLTHMTMKNIWLRMRGQDKNNTRIMAMKRKASKPITPQDRAEKAARDAVRGAKTALTVRQKKLDALQPKDDEPVVLTTPYIGGSATDEAIDPLAGKNVVFRPNEGPQTDFLAASEQEVLYGGAAGGGKSFALLADPMRYFKHKNFRGLVLRRTNDELRELKWKSKELYEQAFKGAIWKEKDSMWVFPSGAQHWMTYLERDEDVMRYQGQSFSYIAVDELTQYPTPFAWNYLRSRLRSAAGPEYEGLPTFMRATTNPGGPGHGWVKRMFIDPAPAGRAFDATNIDTGAIMTIPENDSRFPKEKWGKPLFQRRFIPALLKDNPYLAQGGNYAANLLSLTENQQRQLLEGDWSIADGAAFPEWRQSVHTCEPFEIPKTWTRFRSCDFGYNSWSAVYWYAIDPVYETLVVYRELYVTKHTGVELAHRVLEAERGERIDYGMLDSSVWHVRGHNGPTIEEEMRTAGCRWRPSDRTAGARSSGKNRLHELLKVDQVTGRPGIIFFNTCRQAIADLPIIPADPDGLDDIDKRYTSDHSYDSIRYGIMSRPRVNNPFGWSTDTYTGGYSPADRKFGF